MTEKWKQKDLCWIMRLKFISNKFEINWFFLLYLLKEWFENSTYSFIYISNLMFGIAFCNKTRYVYAFVTFYLYVFADRQK